jgi:hypothetical protein
MAVIIDADLINDTDGSDWGVESRNGTTIEEMPLFGIEKIMGEDPSLPRTDLTMIAFRLYDGDGELYYQGRLHDDDECINQAAALRFGEADAGCAIIKVKRDGEWIQEIA